MCVWGLSQRSEERQVKKVEVRESVRRWGLRERWESVEGA